MLLGIRYVTGSVEAACGLGLADAVVDLVETGTTMKVTLQIQFSHSFVMFHYHFRLLAWKLWQKF